MAGLSQSVSGTYAFKVRVLEADTLVLDLSANVASQGGRERCFFVSVSSISGSGVRENSRAPRSNSLEQGSPPPTSFLPSPSLSRRRSRQTSETNAVDKS